MKGVVVKATGSRYTVRTDDGERIQCVLKGKFRMEGIKTTSPVSVGDRVEIDPGRDLKTGVIKHIEERKNYIIRKSKKLSKVSHILAANIDQAIIIATIKMPRTSTGFIDRFLVTAEAYHIPGVLIINKMDLYDRNDLRRVTELHEIYEKAGYVCIDISALKRQNLDAVIDVLKDKVSLIAGHSGVGKSQMVNAIQPGLNLKTKAISSYHEKGMHATTFIEMHELDVGGFIIDSPGIREFGLIDFDKVEVPERFPEMRALMHQCQFHNCTHVHEPKCAVKQAVESGEIHPERYRNYLSILNDEWDTNDYE